MLRRLASPRWLGALLLAALFAVAAYHLGFWQYHRHEAKVARNAQLDAHYRADPVPLPDVLTPVGYERGSGWTRVTVTGRYVAGPVFARGRPNAGEVGLEALWAFRPEGGGPDVLVDRGWVRPSAQGASVLPDVTPAPAGPLTVVGWLRPSEPTRDRAPAPGQIANLSVPDAAAALGTPVLPGYVLLDTETLPDGTTPPRPAALEPPERGLGPHQAYAYQWWLSTVLGFVLVGFGVRREERLAHPEKYPPKPKKVRIWDEEDE
ncbi:SURF1 family protein [Phycicoccus sp. CSK15P-2]|uniref:SURF1 family cytochrome oxidase biogenesis protein n=1 Tax=Phycicoccus sp. CSK15P-2 TaxID=2807627 RepID=UPI00194F2D6C|nr:SURF1 family protein [Phycicoccus sp. CSK15P-2]MBM6403870.1 SURF1 family protein [Phycicoccus sp. CSK15P-2]